MTREELIKALKEAKQNATGQFEISEDVIGALVPQLTRDGREIDGLKFEVTTLGAMQEKLEDHLKEQFDSMQVGLISFVMHKCGRKTLAIDSREINQQPFTGLVADVTQVDGYTTSYRLRRGSVDRDQ